MAKAKKTEEKKPESKEEPVKADSAILERLAALEAENRVLTAALAGGGSKKELPPMLTGKDGMPGVPEDAEVVSLKDIVPWAARPKQKLWCTRKAYIRQSHQPAPEMVLAAPGHPVQVTVPRFVYRQCREPAFFDGKNRPHPGKPIPGKFYKMDFPLNSFLHEVAPRAPEKTHAPPNRRRLVDGVVQPEVVNAPEQGQEGRLADQEL